MYKCILCLSILCGHQSSASLYNTSRYILRQLTYSKPRPPRTASQTPPLAAPRETCNHSMYSCHSSTPHMAAQRTTPHCVTYRDLLLKNPHTNCRGYENGINVIFWRFVFVFSFYDFYFFFVCLRNARCTPQAALRNELEIIARRHRRLTEQYFSACMCMCVCALDCSVCHPLVLFVCRNDCGGRCGSLLFLAVTGIKFLNVAAVVADWMTIRSCVVVSGSGWWCSQKNSSSVI